MPRRPEPGTGILLAFFLNLIFRMGWLALALVFLALHFWVGLPIWFFIGTLAIWVIIAFIVTFLLSFGSYNQSSLTTQGSKRASERLQNRRQTNEVSTSEETAAKEPNTQNSDVP